MGVRPGRSSWEGVQGSLARHLKWGGFLLSGEGCTVRPTVGFVGWRWPRMPDPQRSSYHVSLVANHLHERGPPGSTSDLQGLPALPPSVPRLELPPSAHAAVDPNHSLHLKRELLRLFKIPLHSYLIFVTTCNGGSCLC